MGAIDHFDTRIFGGRSDLPIRSSAGATNTTSAVRAKARGELDRGLVSIPLSLVINTLRG